MELVSTLFILLYVAGVNLNALYCVRGGTFVWSFQKDTLKKGNVETQGPM